MISAIKRGWPHVQKGYLPGGSDTWVWRLYGIRRHCRLCLFGYMTSPRGTWVRFYRWQAYSKLTDLGKQRITERAAIEAEFLAYRATLKAL